MNSRYEYNTVTFSVSTKIDLFISVWTIYYCISSWGKLPCTFFLVSYLLIIFIIIAYTKNVIKFFFLNFIYIYIFLEPLYSLGKTVIITVLFLGKVNIVHNFKKNITKNIKINRVHINILLNSTLNTTIH